jgi:hypothetical protein
VVSLSPPVIGLSFTVSGRIYQLQRSATLLADSWANVGAPVTGTGAPLQFTDGNAPAGRCFYRISIIP